MKQIGRDVVWYCRFHLLLNMDSDKNIMLGLLVVITYEITYYLFTYITAAEFIGSSCPIHLAENVDPLLTYIWPINLNLI